MFWVLCTPTSLYSIHLSSPLLSFHPPIPRTPIAPIASERRESLDFFISYLATLHRNKHCCHDPTTVHFTYISTGISTRTKTHPPTKHTSHSMARLAVYGAISAALAGAVIASAFAQRSNFYAACVYLYQSNACMMVRKCLVFCTSGMACTNRNSSSTMTWNPRNSYPRCCCVRAQHPQSWLHVRRREWNHKSTFRFLAQEGPEECRIGIERTTNHSRSFFISTPVAVPRLYSISACS